MTESTLPHREHSEPDRGSSVSELDVEQPSGKSASYENFPVGSWLLPARLRPHIATYYAFARAIDDIADSPALSPADKLMRLDGFAQVIADGANRQGFEKADAMRTSLQRTGINQDRCLDLVVAFKQDAEKQRYESWQELLDYCQLSAAPVGQFLIDLHGGCRDGYAASNALCAALQIINHVQDLKDDYLVLDRIYLPIEWLNAAGVSENEFAAPSCSAGLRVVIDRTLAGVDSLLMDARNTATTIISRRLSLEASVILCIAKRLRDNLAHHDPIANRVVLSKPELALCTVRGILSAMA